MEILNRLFSNALAVTILVILGTSLISFYVKMRGRDRCLRDLDGFQVTIETQDGHVAWGALRTYATGVELLYLGADPNQQAGDPSSPKRPWHPTGVGRGQSGGPDIYTKHSYILYNNELPRIECFYRFHDHQSDERRRQRERDIKKTYQPSLPRRSARTLRNVLTTFRDAIIQSLNAILGARAAATQSTLLSKHKDLTASGAQLLDSAVGSAYDPILEHYVGQYVVLEMGTQDPIEEEHGILKEYSAQYIELLNAKVEVPLHIYMRRRPHVAQAQVHVEQEGQAAHVWHDLDYPIVVATLCAGEAQRELDRPVAPGQRVEIALSEAEAAGPVSFAWGVRCLADLVVPRAIARVRHAGRQETLTWEAWLGLDDLPSLPWLKRLVHARQGVPVRQEQRILSKGKRV